MMTKKILLVVVVFLVALSGLAVGLSCSDGGEMSEVSIEGYGQVIDSDGNWVGEPILGLQGPQGLQGEQGPKGDTGDTGPQGLVGPQGPQGETGLPGAGVTWQGEWSTSTEYDLHDAVGYQGSSYISKEGGNTNHLPTDTAWWDLWLAKGETGATGPQGLEGDPGPAGPQGDPGPEGPQGVQGELGPKGDTGDTGAVGPVGPQGDPGPNMIVAMGTIIEGGSQVTVTQDYNVGALYWNVDSWMVELSGMSFYYPDYVTLVTLLGSDGRTAQVNSVSGHLLVKILDSAGNPIQESFSFVVLQVP